MGQGIVIIMETDKLTGTHEGSTLDKSLGNYIRKGYLTHQPNNRVEFIAFWCAFNVDKSVSWLCLIMKKEKINAFTR